MSNSVGSGIKKCRWLWWSGGIVALLLILVVVFHALLPAVAERVAGSLLGVPVSIGNVDLAILGDSLVVEDIRLAQPNGYGDKPMIEVGRVAVEGWRGALSRLRRIEKISVERVRLELVTLADGSSNLAALLKANNADKGSVAKEVEATKGDEFAILVNRVSVSSVVLVRRDHLADGREYRLELLGDQFVVNRLAIGEVANVEPGDIEFTGGILQPGQGVNRAEIYLGGRFSKLGTSAESLRLGARVTGCLFDTFVPIVPSSTGEILGGEGFDADVEIKTAGGLVDVVGGLVTSNHTAYAFSACGPIEAPEIMLPEKFKSVTSRMAGFAGGMVQSVVGGSGELIEGTAKTIGKFGKGIFFAAGNVLKGAGQTTAGVVTADMGKIKAGAGKATMDAGGSVVKAVDDSAVEIGDTAGGTVNALGNEPATQKWIAATPVRHGKRIDGLLISILAEDFPPKLSSKH
jgi:hypothetical protein